MKTERLFHVLVVTGASSVAGIAGCGGDDTPAPTGTGGATTGTGGAATSTGGSAAGAGGGSSCDSACEPAPDRPPNTDWIDCNGCCCWLPAGSTASVGHAICAATETCCAGRGR